MLEEEQKKRLMDAMHYIGQITNFDDHCDDANCTIDTPQCEIMNAQAAIREIRFVLDPPMDTLQPGRLVGARERIFVEEWAKENQAHHGECNSYVLQHILSTEKRQTLGGPVPVLDYVSQRDAHVATSVIQWLGTNCGQSFLHIVNRRIEQEMKEDREVQQMYHRNDWHIRDFFKILEDKLLNSIIPMPYHAEKFSMGKDLAVHLRNEISNALRMVMALFALETGIASLEESAMAAGTHPEAFKKMQALAREAVKRRVRAIRARSLAKPA